MTETRVEMDVRNPLSSGTVRRTGQGRDKQDVLTSLNQYGRNSPEAYLKTVSRAGGRNVTAEFVLVAGVNRAEKTALSGTWQTPFSTLGGV